MKKIGFSVLLLSWGTGAFGADFNPMMGKYQNQVALYLGQGIDSGFLIPPPARFVPFSLVHIQYSQPTTFFKLPARQSLNLAQTIGYGKKYKWNWEKYTIPMVVLTEDVVLLSGERWYYATGIGVGMQAQQNTRIGSKLLFSFKISAGYRLSDNVAGEIFMQHFSNGNTADENNSYAFYGFGLTYSF